MEQFCCGHWAGLREVVCVTAKVTISKITCCSRATEKLYIDLHLSPVAA